MELDQQIKKKSQAIIKLIGRFKGSDDKNSIVEDDIELFNCSEVIKSRV